jgi:hypothetical protein
MAVREYGNRKHYKTLRFRLSRHTSGAPPEVCLESSQIPLNVCPAQNLRKNSSCAYTSISGRSEK